MFVRIYDKNNVILHKDYINYIKNNIFEDNILINKYIECVNIYDEYLLKIYNENTSSIKCHKIKVNTLIVFLHGWGASSKLYSSVLDTLSNYGVVIAPDLFGFGESSELDQKLRLNDYSNGVLKLINLFEFNEIIICGHSFGGKIIFDILSMIENVTDCTNYILSKDKIKGLIFISTAGAKPKFNLIKYLKVMRYKRLKKKCKKNTKYIKKLLKYGSNDYKNANNEFLRQTMVEVVNTHSFEKLNKLSIDYNALIIEGKNDKDTPLYMAKKINRKFINSSLCVILNAGHFPFLDSPYEFDYCLNCWLNRICATEFD